MEWLRFFLGTPRRALTTVAGLTIIFGLFRPDVIGNAVSGLLNALLQAVAPFVGPFLVLGFVIFGLRIMIRGPRRRSGGGGSKK